MSGLEDKMLALTTMSSAQMRDEGAVSLMRTALHTLHSAL
jgi:hypothetical protein